MIGAYFDADWLEINVIEESEVVKVTRKIRCAISEKFQNDPDRYIDYLLSQAHEDKGGLDIRTQKPVRAEQSKNSEGI